MISVSDTVKTLYKTVNSSSVDKNYNISINNGAITLQNTELVYGTFKLEQKLCSADTLTFGECNAAMIQFQCASNIGNVKGKDLVLKQNINSNITQLGKYTIDSCEITENKKYRTITAYDNIYRFNVNVSEWYEALTFPITMLNMLKSLCTYVGVTYNVTSLLNGSMPTEKTISADDLQGITVLKCIAELNGGFFRADVNGLIEFVSLSTSAAVDTIDIKLYSSLKKEDYATHKYDKLNIRTEEGDIGVISGTGDNAYIIEDNFLVYGKNTSELQPIADNVFSVINNISYVPFSASQVGLPYLQVGDYVKYNTINGTFSSLVLTRSLSGTQVLKDSIESKGTEKTEETFGITKEIIKLKGKSNVLTRTIEETRQTVSDLQTDINGNYSTTTQMNSAITQKANEIISTVSSTYTTKEDFNNLEIGGRNLCQNSNSINLFSYVTSGNFTTKWVDNAKFLGKKHFEAKCTVAPKSAGGYFIPFLCISGKQYTWSFYAKSSVERIHRVGNENGGIKNITVTTEWQKFTHTFTANDNFGKAFVFYNNHVINDILYIADFKIEEGDIATSWTPAPEDTDADIDNINNKFNNYSTTTQMNSAITQKANEITSTVSSTYTTKSDFESLEIGGRNLSLGTKEWDNTAFSKKGSSAIIRDGVISVPVSDFSYATNNIDVIAGEIYTIGFDAKSTTAYRGNILLVQYYDDTETRLSYGWIYTDIYTEFKRISVTITIPAGVTKFNLGIRSFEYINYYKLLKIEKGNKATDWTPAPEDIDDDIDNINNKFNNYSTTSEMNSVINQTADSINLTVSQTISSVEAELGTKASTSSVNSLSEDLADFSNETIEALSSMQNQIDGSIMTWFYSVPPTTSNTPANGWATVNDKNKHLGDLYYDTVTGYCYRWQVLNNTYSWQRITDTDVTKALEDASKAQDTADSKRRVFTTTPTTPYEIGDLWSGGSSGELKRCKVTRLTGSYTSSDWELATRYTDDTTANQIANNLSANYSTTTQMNSAITQKANEITSTVSSTYTTKEDFNNLEIGGRNLSLGTKDWNDSAFSVKGNTATITDGVISVPVSDFSYATNNIDVIAGEIYTIGFDAKSTTAYRGNILLVQYYDDTETRLSYGWIYTDIYTEFKRISVTITIPAGVTKLNLGIRSFPYINYYKLLKIEKGNKATDWTPAPEDVDNKFNSYSTTTQMNSAINETANNINLSVSEKITETNDGTVDEKSGTELHSTLSHDSYCLLTEIDGVTYQAAPPTVATTVEINNIPATFNITSQGTEKTHTEQIKLSAPLCYADKIVMATGDITINGQIVKKGDWYVVRNSKKMIFNYEAHVTTQGSTGTYTRFLITPKTPALAKDQTTAQYSNKYKFSRDYNSDTEHFFVSETSGIIVVFDTATTVTEFKNKLASKALEVEYQLAIPEYEILNDETQDALHNIVTYAGNTLITTDLALKPNMHGVFKSNLYGKTVDNKASIDVQSKSIVLKVDNAGNIVSVAIGEDAEDGNVVKVTGNMIVDGAVTAKKINITDLFTLNATIGSWKINKNEIYTEKFYPSGSGNLGVWYRSYMQPSWDAQNYVFGIVTADGSSDVRPATWRRLWDADYQGNQVCQYLDVAKSITAAGIIEICTDVSNNASNLILHNNYDRKAYIRIDSNEYLWLVPHTSSGFDSAHGAFLNLLNGAFNAVSFVNRSSARFKENIKDMTEDFANKLEDVRICSFDYKADFGEKGQYGVIAEEINNIYPHVVFRDNSGNIESVDYTKLIPILIKKTQMQEQEINELKKGLQQQQQEINNMKEMLNELLADKIDTLSETEVSE